METNLDEIRDTMCGAMITNFEKDGYLAPIVFFHKGDDILISEIPNELLSTQQGKSMIADTIKMVCSSPETTAVGMIIEAYGAKFDKKDDSNAKDIMSGKKRVSDLEEKQDIIIMIFSTPEKEELISYVVDPETKKVGEKFSSDECDKMAGTFSGFFSWKKD